MFQMEILKDFCLVCQSTKKTRRHFGVTSCMACSSFFRRSLNSNFTCIANNSCIISSYQKQFCRSCRYNKCVASGMRREHIRKQVNSVWSDTHQHDGKSEEKDLKNAQDFSRNRKINEDYQKLLSFYVEETKESISRKRHDFLNNAFQIKNSRELLEISNSEDKTSLSAVLNCYGTYILEDEDMKILIKYFKFMNIWIDSAFVHSTLSKKQEESNENDFCKFIQQIGRTIRSSLKNLNPNIVEYAALRAICIWNLKFYEKSPKMKRLGEEHYNGVTGALRQYYEGYMSDDDIAVRMGEITMQITTVSDLYHDLNALHQKYQIPF